MPPSIGDLIRERGYVRVFTSTNSLSQRNPLITFNMILNMSKLEETAPSPLGICPLVATEYYWMRMTITARAKD